MPVWGQVILGASAIVTAIGILWSRVFRPGMRAASAAEEMLPLLRELTKVFRDSPDSFTVLHEIAGQFRTDSGSSLRDVVNRLEAAAIENQRAAAELKVGVESSRILAERDRGQVDHLLILLDRLTIRVDDVSASGARIELDRAVVAEGLAAREAMVDAASAGVADDLAAAHLRADAAAGDAGSAADAAAQTAPAEELLP